MERYLMTVREMTVNPDDAAAPAKPGAGEPAVRPQHRRAAFVRWMRKTHGWFGLWGALLGLTFGTSGIWLNHRAVLKLPPMSQQRMNAQLALPDPAPATAAEMAVWLQRTLALDRPPNSTRIEPARRVAWAGPDDHAAPRDAQPTAALQQPERWVFSFGGPHAVVQADYWRGNRSVGVITTSNGLVATLTNMHKGVGMSLGWILLVDTLAGSLIFLSLSGVILWLQTCRRRGIGLMIFGVSIVATLGLALARL
ncbi:MAG TPA: PepSY-associated TM helix domain-containing protein [Rhodoferax sp.]|nr:PepSY-associated TM helix domain-containing protein [Rhodoferax sp.]